MFFCLASYRSFLPSTQHMMHHTCTINNTGLARCLIHRFIERKVTRKMQNLRFRVVGPNTTVAFRSSPRRDRWMGLGDAVLLVAAFEVSGCLNMASAGLSYLEGNPCLQAFAPSIVDALRPDAPSVCILGTQEVCRCVYKTPTARAATKA